MMAKKYSKFTDQDHEVKTFRWPYWLLPLLFLSLILVLGLFIFITIHSTDRFGCFFHCEQKIDDGGLVPPHDEVFPSGHRRYQENKTENAPKFASQVNNGTQTIKQLQLVVHGKLIFKDKVPDSIPTNSHLEVKLEDTSLMDAPAIFIASTEVDLSLYKKGTPLKYEIKCPMPAERVREYSVDAVLNMGWKPKTPDWIREGDYMVDTTHTVELKKNMTKYERDIDLVFYQ